MEKPGNWFALAKMWEKLLKNKEILRKGPASLLRFYYGTRIEKFAMKYDSK